MATRPGTRKGRADFRPRCTSVLLFNIANLPSGSRQQCEDRYPCKRQYVAVTCGQVCTCALACETRPHRFSSFPVVARCHVPGMYPACAEVCHVRFRACPCLVLAVRALTLFANRNPRPPGIVAHLGLQAQRLCQDRPVPFVVVVNLGGQQPGFACAVTCGQVCTCALACETRPHRLSSFRGRPLSWAGEVRGHGPGHGWSRHNVRLVPATAGSRHNEPGLECARRETRDDAYDQVKELRRIAYGDHPAG